MANNEKPQKAKNGFKQKLNSVGGWAKSNLKMIGAVVLVLGLGFGLGWWARNTDYKEAQAKVTTVTSELDQAKTELDNIYNQGGDCYDSISGLGGPCPSIKILEAKRINDPALTGDNYFVAVDIEVENTHDKQSASVAATSIKLKDDKFYVYPMAEDFTYNSKSETVTYGTIEAIPVLNDLYDLNLAAGEKVRGTVIYKVARSAGSFTLSYSTVVSEPFSL